MTSSQLSQRNKEFRGKDIWPTKKDWASVMMRWKGYQQGAKADLQEERDWHVDKTVVRRSALLRN